MFKLVNVNFFLLFSVIGFAQINSTYFNSPLKIPLVLSGTFGELRGGHFHSGLDIKTQGVSGLNTYAAAQGYVSRIKISNYGYGKALYIQHPNGYTTVYAHLSAFSSEIEDYVKKMQYLKETYEIELFPKVNELKVAKEEIIALTGNSGGSGGPHLHFEIRDAQQRPMNPLLFGIDIADTRKPLVNTIWLYPLDENSHINGQQKPYRLKIQSQKNGNIRAFGVNACGNIGVGVSTVDQQNAANNRNGYYKISTALNGEPRFELKMKRFSFAETRYINNMIDYSYYIKNISRITKLFIPKNTPLSIYNKKLSNGIFSIAENLTYNISVKIEDIKGNFRNITIPITGENQDIETLITKKTEHKVYPNKTFKYSNDFMSLFIPNQAVYNTVDLNIEVLPDNAMKIHENTTALHKYMNVSFLVPSYLDTKKSYIGAFSGDNYKTPRFKGATHASGKITARVREFGNYKVFEDTIPPVIRALNFSNNKWISNNKTLKVWINDKQTGIKKYKATINNNFALMEYDYKTKKLTYNFKDSISVSGKNNFKLYVEDNVGNNAIFESSFYRK